MTDPIFAVRRFNRFYTRLIGALDVDFLGSDVTLPEARLLFEIAQHEPVMANALQSALGMDAGYVSRIIRRFEKRGLIARDHGEDSRARPIRLTAKGRETFDLIDRRQRDAVARMVDRLDPVQQSDLVQAIAHVQLLLGTERERGFTIRPFRTGDMGLIAARQSILYAQSHNWGRGLEVLEGEVTTAFLRDYDPGCEHCWIAEMDGVMAGSIMLTDEGDDVARLRLLYVEPFAQRQGIGDALVETCIAFARDKQYSALMLWTHTVLDAARRIYARHGFERIDVATHREFGDAVEGETWRLVLTAAA